MDICIVPTSTCQPWNKARGVQFLVTSHSLRLADQAVLVCGDTMSDVPMVEYVLQHNKQSTFTIFVNASSAVKERLTQLYEGKEGSLVFVSCPSVIHCAFAQYIAQHSADL